MGLLEEISKQITETNQGLSNQIALLNDKISTLESKIKTGQTLSNNAKVMSFEFEADDRLNISFASKFLGMTKAEVILLVKKGKINSVGMKKYIFLVSDLIQYKNGFKSGTPILNKPKDKLKGINNNSFKSLINDNDLQELLAKQTG